MITAKASPDFRSYYAQKIRRHQRQAWACAAGVLVFFGLIGYYSTLTPALVLAGICLLLIGYLHRHYTRRYRQRLALLDQPFPPAWQNFLAEHVSFYARLNPAQRAVFDQRVAFFLAEVPVEGISTEVDDDLRLLVAASAIIPTFAFPYYEYRNLRQVLLYPNSFDHRFQTAGEASDRTIAGMVGNGFLNGSLLLSKSDLVQGFKGRNPHNVGIHEFVHLLDMADGAVDGLPEIFLDHSYTRPWLQVIRAEVQRMRRGSSDINPYGLTNDAEFLAVVSEYFFDDPEKFRESHPQLYDFLCTIFHQDPDGNAQ